MKVCIKSNVKISASDFQSTYIPKIVEAMKNPDTCFIFTDESGASLFAAKYLFNNRYRACVMYIVNKPRHTVGRYPVKEFTMISERNAAVISDADEIIG
jgi:hypothetical protein